jgi:hypothetical protein
MHFKVQVIEGQHFSIYLYANNTNYKANNNVLALSIGNETNDTSSEEPVIF